MMTTPKPRSKAQDGKANRPRAKTLSQNWTAWAGQNFCLKAAGIAANAGRPGPSGMNDAFAGRSDRRPYGASDARIEIATGSR